ncbi:sulfatase [Thalassoglobus neptunius]|nr:sulfatase [Thalassoglobus neptunius]
MRIQFNFYPAWLICLVVVSACVASHRLSAEDALPPNVLFILVDDLNCDLGCYGHPLVQSPQIDELAATALRFSKAYSQYPVCNPSRSSLMTGLYPEQTGVLSNSGNFRKRHPDLTTLPQHFMNHGYFAARVGKIYHYGVPDQIGTPGEDDPGSWDATISPRGRDRDVHDRIHSLIPGKFGGTLSWLNLDTPDEDQTDGRGATAAIEIMKQHRPEKTGKPFFLAVGFYRPHTPYVAPSKYFDLYDRDAIEPVMEKPGDRDDIPHAALPDRAHQRTLTVPQRQEIIQAYYAAISYMDAQVGRLLDALAELDLEENTIVVFASDHGYHLGHHGLWQKSDLFEGSCRVPMMIRVPGHTSSGQVHKHPVELLDLYPTVSELCGLEIPPFVLGDSLTEVLADPTAQTGSAAYSVTKSRGGNLYPELKGKDILGRTIRTDRYRYTEWGDEAEYGVELYDYELDPEEFTNLANTKTPSAIQRELQSRLLVERRNANSSVANGSPNE